MSLSARSNVNEPFVGATGPRASKLRISVSLLDLPMGVTSSQQVSLPAARVQALRAAAIALWSVGALEPVKAWMQKL